MAEPLKNMFSHAFFKRLAADIKSEYPQFREKEFINACVSELRDLSLLQRLRHGSLMLRQFLPENFKTAAGIVMNVSSAFPAHYTSFLFPDFIGQFGHNDVKFSLNALKYLTQFGTSEFAIREFLKRDLEGTLKVMYSWAEDENYHVRRLASEGSRPRLPWSFNLPAIAAKPDLTRPILEKLKADDVLYIKKSVANHLNDFSRIDPEYMLNVVRSWDSGNPHTAWIIRHASRTLIKQGHQGSMELFRYEKEPKITVSTIRLSNKKIRLGDSLSFDFSITSLGSKSQKLVVDYAIHFAKNRGTLAPKVFKLREITLDAGDTLGLNKIQHFRQLTTRRHYSGRHELEIMVNGRSLAKATFHLEV